MSDKCELRDSQRIALIATLSGLAGTITLLKLSIPFPILAFLKFDLAEIPDVLSFILLGPTGGLITTIIHWLILNFGAPFQPVIGPTMKLLAIMSTFIGIYLSIGVRPVRLKSARLTYITMITYAMFFRVVIMGVATFLLYYVFFPNVYLKFAREALSLIGLKVEESLEVALIMVLLTGIFNSIHVLISVIPSLTIFDRLRSVRGVLARGNWLSRKMSEEI